MDYRILQAQYDAIHAFLKTTTEPFDSMDWDGTVLTLWYGDRIAEMYTLEDFKLIIPHFPLSLRDLSLPCRLRIVNCRAAQ